MGWSLPVAPTREEGAPQSLSTGPRGTSLHSPPPPQGMSPAWWGPWGAGPQAKTGSVSRNQESASSPTPHHGSPVAPWAFTGPWLSNSRIWDPSLVSKEQVAPGALSLILEQTWGGEGPWRKGRPLDPAVSSSLKWARHPLGGEGWGLRGGRLGVPVEVASGARPAPDGWDHRPAEPGCRWGFRMGRGLPGICRESGPWAGKFICASVTRYISAWGEGHSGVLAGVGPWDQAQGTWTGPSFSGLNPPQW